MDSADDIVLFITAIALALSRGKSTDEIRILAAIFVQLGETLETIAVKREIQERRASEQRSSLQEKFTSSDSFSYTS